MKILSKEEKKELLYWSKSVSLKKDMQKLKNRKFQLKNPDFLNEYIKFLTFINSIANHPQKKIKKITGNNFKI